MSLTLLAPEGDGERGSEGQRVKGIRSPLGLGRSMLQDLKTQEPYLSARQRGEDSEARLPARAFSIVCPASVFVILERSQILK
jgi:hypothetical protein